MTAFSDELRRRRTDLRLTQAAAAAEVGVSTSTLSKWERGEATPSPRYEPALAALLGTALTRVGGRSGGADGADAPDTAVERLDSLETRCAELEARCAELAGALAALDATCSLPVTELSDGHGNSVTLDAGGVTIDGSVVRLGGGLVQCTAGLASFAGVLKAAAVVTDSVVAASYTPGAGNLA